MAKKKSFFKQLRSDWRALKAARPGHRFQERYERRREEPRKPGQRAMIIGAGVLLVAVAIVFLITPGPGIPLLIVGAGLLARESLLMARFLDWSELRLRKMFTRLKRASLGAKVALGTGVAAVLAGAGLIVYFKFLD